MTGSYIDDGLCSGLTVQTHLTTLKNILQRMRDWNYFLSRKKCEFMKNSIEYLRHVISKEGIHTSPSKVECIQAIQRPTSVTEVKSFLGLVNFYRKFIPFLSDSCEPLNRLTHTEHKWKWTDECQSAFDKVKSKLSSTQSLAHFDPVAPIGISCDASSIGLGVVWFH